MARAQRIVTLEEFMRQPRTKHEVDGYHHLLDALQSIGLVDAELNIVPPGKRRVGANERK